VAPPALIDGSPTVMLPGIDIDEAFFKEKRDTVAPMLLLHSSGGRWI
jgi:hypothetical protein